jgi:ATP-dependent DNA helicase RecG
MPSSIEKLQKILKLEAELGYENKAVVGGLEKFLPSWVNEAQSAKLDGDLIQTIVQKINEYRGLDIPKRTKSLEELFKLLSSFGLVTPQVGDRPLPKEALIQKTIIDSQVEPFRQKTNAPVLTPRPENKNRPVSAFPRPPANNSPVGLNAPLTVLYGIGPKNAELLQTLNLFTLEDLLYYFPRRYDDYSQLKTINRLQYGEELTVVGTIQSIVSRPVRGGQSQITEAILSDGTGALRLSWFNQPWLSNRLSGGTQVVLSGKIDMYLGRLVMNSPDWEYMEQEHLHTNRIVPVYPLSGRITQRALRKIMHETVTFWAPRLQDYLPAAIRQAAGLVSLSTALQQINFPDSQEKLKEARQRLAFNEIFLLQLGALRQKRSWQAGSAQVFDAGDGWMAEQTALLPYTLTNAQERALKDMRSDLASGRPMNRLLQGDVGSGKTIIAALSIGIVTKQGAQAAIMAPTSILAEQHYRNLQKILANDSLLKLEEIRLLVGDTPEAEKREIRSGLDEGSIKLVIGTHALLEEPVTFKRLQLAVVDEQHRFGVSQRAILRAKGENPHLLVMTATPIPRSLALTVYGDLDLSVMDEMPAGRIPIETHIIHPLERERAYQLIQSQIEAGHQAFIIYPFVERGEKDEGKAAVNEHARLQAEVFPNNKLGLLHGRLKPEEKEDVMRHFRDGDLQILVSTSVVEVGVDVPNATVMLIEGANRFGLAQLHQFRGRVGRGLAQSYCLLIPETEDALENERLAAMEETNDGFVLAERDLEQRGPGDFLGIRQSGYTELHMANLSDIRLIEKARQQAIALFERDPELTAPENLDLAQTFQKFWGVGQGDVS